nr:HAMP domain-containing sensor histidine kinase [Metabacillus mangrovi]
MLHSIYVRFILLFFGILILSALLSLGIVTVFQLEGVKGMVQEQLEDKITAIDSLASERDVPLTEAIRYLDGQELTIQVYRSQEELLEAKQFTVLEKDLKKLHQGSVVTKEFNSNPPLPVAAALISGDYVTVYPDLENNQIARFQKTAQTVLLTAIILGSLLILPAVSMIVKPIKRISKASVQVANGTFDVQIQHKGKDEVGELVKNFNIMVQELKANEYLHKEFVSSVSHEFKTPLSSINGFAKLLKTEGLPEKEKKEYADIIMKESERLSNLSSNLLRLSKLDYQAVQYKRDTFNLDEQIRRVILLLQDQWEKKQIRLHVDLDQIQFRGDEELLQQVWLNLFVNAIKFTPEAGVIRLTLEETDDRIIFSIADNGIGIHERDLPRIFERFYKADKSRSGIGTGLGLPIVKKIVEIHEGTITVESKPGEGSTFTVELPV